MRGLDQRDPGNPQGDLCSGSADIEADALSTIDGIATVLKDCSYVEMEIAGHTDSQGREAMNQQLSQRRAEAVLTALQARRVLTGNLTPKGYGEANPIADNDTEEGREANRRIEFTPVKPDPEADQEPSAETDAEVTSETEPAADNEGANE